ncbi:hypothetical protein FOXYSP1_08912 [Fusarium oxysporum f. sp. phaseoli]|jgi:hypothetical protein
MVIKKSAVLAVKESDEEVRMPNPKREFRQQKGNDGRMEKRWEVDQRMRKGALFCFRNAVRLGRGGCSGRGAITCRTGTKFPVFQGKCLRRWSTRLWLTCRGPLRIEGHFLEVGAHWTSTPASPVSYPRSNFVMRDRR